MHPALLHPLVARRCQRGWACSSLRELPAVHAHLNMCAYSSSAAVIITCASSQARGLFDPLDCHVFLLAPCCGCQSVGGGCSRPLLLTACLWGWVAGRGRPLGECSPCWGPHASGAACSCSAAPRMGGGRAGLHTEWGLQQSTCTTHLQATAATEDGSTATLHAHTRQVDHHGMHHYVSPHLHVESWLHAVAGVGAHYIDCMFPCSSLSCMI